MIFQKMGEYNPKIDYLVCKNLLSTLPGEFDYFRLKRVLNEEAEPLKIYEKEIVYIKDVLCTSDLSTIEGLVQCINAITDSSFSNAEIPDTDNVEAALKSIFAYQIERDAKLAFAQLFILHIGLKNNKFIIPFRKFVDKMLSGESEIFHYLEMIKIKTAKYTKPHNIEYNAEAVSIVIKNADDFRKRLDAIKVGIYGSMVTGEATRYSDVDVLVMVGDDRDRMEAKRRAIEYWRPILPIDVDVCAVRESDFDKLPVGITGTLKILGGQNYD